MINNKLAVLLAAFLLLNVMQVSAEDKMPPEHKMNADTNKDGKISYDEYRASKEKQMERQFKRMDTNGDGFIDESEKQAAKDKMRDMREKRKAKQDAT
jgi:Ca2+-binding EF-hand superfamily protein